MLIKKKKNYLIMYVLYSLVTIITLLARDWVHCFYSVNRRVWFFGLNFYELLFINCARWTFVFVLKTHLAVKIKSWGKGEINSIQFNGMMCVVINNDKWECLISLFCLRQGQLSSPKHELNALNVQLVNRS